MPRLTALEAVERYVRAAEERNIRLNYVRLPVSATPRTYADSVDYVRSIARGLVHSKLGLGSPLAFSEVWPHPLAGRVAAAAVALGIGGGAVLLLAGLVPLALERQATLGIVAGLGCALAAGSGVNMAVQLLALLAAVTFPMLAFVLFPQPVGAFDGHPYAETRERRSGLLSAVLEFLLLSAVTLAGAGMVAALLSELPYLVKVRAFSGIKLAHVAPLLLVAWIYLTGMSGEYPSWRVERDAIAQRLRDFFNEPIRVWHTVAMLVGLVALALLVARTGNDAGIGVSPTELRFRALLDRVLGVRPRTKEFLVGHPALLLALLLAARPRWRLVALPLLLVGVIGQVSMLNSFCHLHSPIKLTLARTWNGVWSGGLIGLALILFWLWLAPRLGGVLPPRRSQARAPDEYQTV